MAKIGNEISADFILVGSVEDFSIEEKVTKILSSDQEIKRNVASIYLSYSFILQLRVFLLFSNFAL